MPRSKYTAAQRQSFARRPTHIASDQEVLHALLTSREFGTVTVDVLRAGQEIAQLHMADGYAPCDRVRHLWKRTPPIVHSQAHKPWRDARSRPAHQDVSPYLYIALRYAHLLPAGAAWAEPQTLPGKTLRPSTFNEPNLAGLPFAIWVSAQRKLRVRTRMRSMFTRSQS